MPLFNKVTCLYPATFLKEKSPIPVFSDEFCEILKTTFLQNTTGHCFCYTEKYFINKIVENPLGKKMETADKRNHDIRKKKLTT